MITILHGSIKKYRKERKGGGEGFFTSPRDGKRRTNAWFELTSVVDGPVYHRCPQTKDALIITVKIVFCLLAQIFYRKFRSFEQLHITGILLFYSRTRGKNNEKKEVLVVFSKFKRRYDFVFQFNFHEISFGGTKYYGVSFM